MDVTTTASAMGTTYQKNVAMTSNGDVYMVGAEGDSSSGFVGSNTVYVYQRTLDAWNLRNTVPAATCTNCGFGMSVSMDEVGTYAVVGAPYDNSGQGATYFLTWNGASWAQQKIAAGSCTNCNLGTSVAMSKDANYAISSMPFRSTGGGSDGAIQFYSRSGATWSTMGSLISLSACAGTICVFGRSVDMDGTGTYAVAGAPLYVGGSTGTGAVAVYLRSGSTWSAPTILQATGTAPAGANCGQTVSISYDGSVIATGCYFDTNIGSVVVFTRSGSTWTLQTRLLAGDHAGSFPYVGVGTFLSRNGDGILMGARNDNSGVGAFWNWKRVAGVWEKIGTKIPGHAFGSFGSALVMSDDEAHTLVVAKTFNSSRGAVYYYTKTLTGAPTLAPTTLSPTNSPTTRAPTNSPTTRAPTPPTSAPSASPTLRAFPNSYTQRMDVTTTADAMGAEFTRKLAMLPNGNTYAVGAPGSSSVTLAGSNTMYVYDRSGATWSLRNSVAGNTCTRCGFGSSVSMSETGEHFIVGAPFDSTNAGAVYFLRWIGIWTQSKIASGCAGCGLGTSVAMSRDGLYAVSGMPTRLFSAWYGNAAEGGATFYSRPSGSSTWSAMGSVVVPSACVESDCQFGRSVDIDGTGTYAVVGAPLHNSLVGSAFVYLRSTTTWSMSTVLNPTGVSASAGCGLTVAISHDGSAVAMGCTSDGSSGSVVVFTRSGSTWTAGTRLVTTGHTGTAPLVGRGLFMTRNGDGIVVGARDDNTGVGAFWNWKRVSGTWQQMGTKISGFGGNFGSALAMSDDEAHTLVVANSFNSTRGAVYYYRK